MLLWEEEVPLRSKHQKRALAEEIPATRCARGFCGNLVSSRLCRPIQFGRFVYFSCMGCFLWMSGGVDMGGT